MKRDKRGFPTWVVDQTNADLSEGSFAQDYSLTFIQPGFDGVSPKKGEPGRTVHGFSATN